MFDKLLSFYTKYFAVWVILFGIAAYYAPEPFTFLKGYIDWFFALTMFGIGVVLAPEDFKNIASRPIIVLIGVIAQFTIMPLGAFMVVKLFRLPPEIAVGLVLTGSAPGAMASNVMSYIANADIAYSVSLTTASTLLAPVLTPGLTYILVHSMLRVDFWAIFFSVIKMVIIPLFAGFLIKYIFKRRIDSIIKIFPAISVTFIIFICALVIAINRQYLAMITTVVIAAVLILNVFGMFMGYGVGKIFKMARSRRKALSIEIGMQNAGLGTVLALKHFGERSAIPAAVFVFICIITAAVAAEYWGRKKQKQVG